MAGGRVFALIGVAAGFLSGLLGVGGGFVMVPAQVIWGRTRQLQANATSLAAIIPLSVAGVLIYYFVGSSGGRHEADVRFATVMTAGAVVGAYLGARLVTRLPERTLKAIVAIVFLAVGVKQLLLPGT